MNTPPITVAVLLTCHNRKAHTAACLRRLAEVTAHYNADTTHTPVAACVYLTDDGCTDGTAEAARAACKDISLHIVGGDGSLFWAGGMRAAWREAMKEGARWQYYLLINDDTLVCDNVYSELFAAVDHARTVYGRTGICSGITCDPEDPKTITYGGDVFEGNMHGKSRRVAPTGEPQPVDITNANILLVPQSVVSEVGIFADGFRHGCADHDYCMQVRRHGIPALVTAHVCGQCADDHTPEADLSGRMAAMTMAERRAWVRHPLHSDSDYLLYVWRNNRRKYIFSWALRKLRLYCPKLYCAITKARGVY